jgi:hypothetical protein
VAVAVPHGRGEERRLALGVAIQGAFAQAQDIGDIADLRPLIPVGDEDLRGGGNDSSEPVVRDETGQPRITVNASPAAV